MKGTNHDLADSKGIGLWIVQSLFKIIVFIPAIILSLIQVIKDKWTGGWFYSLSYASDCWGNVLIGPHANANWIPENGYKFGKVEPISKGLAINLYQGTYFPPMIKYVRLTELDKNHMAKTLRAHKPDFDQDILNQRLIEMETRRKQEKPSFMNRFKVPIILFFVLAVGIPLNIKLPLSPWSIGYDVLMPIWIWLVLKKK